MTQYLSGLSEKHNQFSETLVLLAYTGTGLYKIQKLKASIKALLLSCTDLQIQETCLPFHSETNDILYGIHL